jgi:hypothetical protein
MRKMKSMGPAVFEGWLISLTAELVIVSKAWVLMVEPFSSVLSCV